MAARFRPYQKGPLKGKHIFLIALILITIISIQGFLFVERNLEPALKEIATTYVKQLATLAINDAISKKISDDLNETEGLVQIKTDNEGNLQMIEFDQSKQARIVTQVVDRANQILMELSKEPIEIPIGQALNSNILAQLGPNVPITLFPMGAARADIKYQLKEAGINNVLIEIILTIEADVRIVIPFSSDEAIVTTELPVDGFYLQGDVPQYYFRGSDSNQTPVPNISLPND